MLPQVDVFRRVEPEAVHPHLQPVPADGQGGLPYRFLIIVQLRHFFGEIAFHLDPGILFLPENPPRRRPLPISLQTYQL